MKKKAGKTIHPASNTATLHRYMHSSSGGRKGTFRMIRAKRSGGRK